MISSFGFSKIRSFFGFFAVLFALGGLSGGSIAVAADKAETSLKVAYDYYQQQRYDLAIGEFQKFLKDYPKHEKKNEAEFFLAESLFQRNRPEEAFTHFDNVCSQALSLIKTYSSQELDATFYAEKVKPKISVSLNANYGRDSLFRAGEIAYLSDDRDNAHKLLFVFILEFPEDPLNSRTLPYLGDIAKQNYAYAMGEGYISYARVFAQEAEHYFNQSLNIFPKGDLAPESRFGLAWAKARLGYYEEATPLFRQIATDGSDLFAEKAYYEWGLMYYEQGNYEQALSTLATFERRFPDSDLLNDSLRIRAKSQAGLKKYDEASTLLSQIKNRTGEDYLLYVRCLSGKGQWDEAKRNLADLEKSVYAESIKDDIRLQQSLFKAGDKDWNGAIYILEPFLGANYSNSTKKMTFTYFDQPKTTLATTPVSYKGKLSEESFLKACGVLCSCYANTGNWPKSDATYNAMIQFAKPEDARQAAVLERTDYFLSLVGTNGSGSTATGGTSGSSGSGGIVIPIDPGLEGGFDYGVAVVEDSSIKPIGGTYRPSPTEKPSSPRYGRNDSRGSESRTGDSRTDSGSSRTRDRNSSRSSSDPKRVLQDCRTLLRNGKLEDADRKLLALLATDPLPQTGAEAALLRSEVMLKMGNESEAEVMSDLILSTYRNDDLYAEALDLRGRYYESEGKTDESLQLFRQVVRDYPKYTKSDGPLFHLAWDDLDAGEETSARTKFTKIYRNYPEGEYWSHATWGLAYLAYKSKNYSTAEQYIQQVLLHPPDAAILDRTLFLKGEIAMQRGDWSVAESAFRTLVRNCRDSALIGPAKTNAELARDKNPGLADSSQRRRQ